MKVTDWYLIRHAPVIGVTENIYKSSDEMPDLSQKAKLEKLAARLPDGAIWQASPLKRTLLTAQALADLKPEKIMTSIDNRLTEQDFGQWFGLSFDQLWQEIKPLPPHNWSLLAAESQPPGGESFRQLWQRVGEYLAEFTPTSDDSPPRVIVSHAGVIRAVLGHVLGLEPDKALSFAFAPLSLTRLQYCDTNHRGGQWRISCLNENFGE